MTRLRVSRRRIAPVLAAVLVLTATRAFAHRASSCDAPEGAEALSPIAEAISSSASLGPTAAQAADALAAEVTGGFDRLGIEGTIRRRDLRRRFANYANLGDFVRRLLGHLGRTSATRAEIEAAVRPWALAALAPLTGPDGAVSGRFADYDEILLWRAVERAREENEFTAARNPSGVDLRLLRERWEGLDAPRGERTFLRPMVLGRGRSLATLRRRFDLGGARLRAQGVDAVDSFFAGWNDPAAVAGTEPIQAAMRSPGIVSRYHLRETGDSGYVADTLVVVDEHGQAWALRASRAD